MWSVEFFHTEWDTVPDLTEQEAYKKYERMVACIVMSWEEFDILAENLPKRVVLKDGDGDVVNVFDIDNNVDDFDIFTESVE